jgi:hypothetical protein
MLWDRFSRVGVVDSVFDAVTAAIPLWPVALPVAETGAAEGHRAETEKSA